MIDKRPKAVENRKEFGHWEGDTAVSRKSLAALQILIERKTLAVKLTKLKRKTADEMDKAITKRLRHYKKGVVKTITYDNGTENAFHEKTNKKLGCKSYFCNPYHSWEKGSVENVIGMVRWFFPKRTDFAKLTDQKIKEVEDFINKRPRKGLAFDSAYKRFKDELRSVALTH